MKIFNKISEIRIVSCTKSGAFFFIYEKLEKQYECDIHVKNIQVS